MANTHENLASLFTDIADSIRAKTGSTEGIVADNFPEEIAAIDTQEDLDPELADQDAKIAELQELLQGKAVPAPEDLTEELAAQSEIIAEQDELITQLASALEGKTSIAYPTLSNPASAENIESGYEAIDANGNVMSGTHVCVLSGASNAITDKHIGTTKSTDIGYDWTSLITISGSYEHAAAIVYVYGYATGNAFFVCDFETETSGKFAGDDAWTYTFKIEKTDSAVTLYGKVHKEGVTSGLSTGTIALLCPW